MKKVFAMFLALLMLMSLCACAGTAPEPTVEPTPEPQDFILRNGIMFGDSRNTIYSKETFTFQEFLQDDDEYGGYLHWTNEGEVSGYDGTKIRFSFDKNDELKEMEYYFDGIVMESYAENRYDTIYDGLVRKYGEPLEYTGELYPITTKVYGAANLLISLSKIIEGKGNFEEYAEWVIEVNDEYSVKIDLLNYYTYNATNKQMEYEMRLAYRAFNSDDIISVAEAEVQNQMSVDEDL